MPFLLWWLGISIIFLLGLSDAQNCNPAANIGACRNLTGNCAGQPNCLDCSGLGWTSFPCASRLPNGLTYLYLSNNNFTTVPANAFGGVLAGSSIDGLWLYLDNNQISTIAAGAFSNITNLYILYLRYNNFTSIQANTFSGLAFASSGNLDLDNNQISTVAAGAFSNITNLRTLSLQYNNMTSIQASAFSGLAFLSFGGYLFVMLHCDDDLSYAQDLVAMPHMM